MQSIVRTAHRYAPKVAAGASAPSALRCPKKSSRCSLARFFRPLRVLRLAASATGGARLRTPYPSPAAGEGPSGQIAARSTHRLGIMTSCYRFAETKLKINLISVVASDATFAQVGLTLRFAPGSPPCCGASSFPHKVLRPCWGPDYTGCTDALRVFRAEP